MLLHLPALSVKRVSGLGFLVVFGVTLCLGGCGQGRSTAVPSPGGTVVPLPDPISHVYKCGERPALSPSSQGPLTLRLAAVRADRKGAPVVDYTITSAMAANITNPSDTRLFRLLILDHGIVVGGQNPSVQLQFNLMFVGPAKISPARPTHGTVDLYVPHPCPGRTWQELGEKGSPVKAVLVAMPRLTTYVNHRNRNILTARLSATAPLAAHGN
ncbi:hypothetical protein [Actinomadura napierensis]